MRTEEQMVEELWYRDLEIVKTISGHWRLMNFTTKEIIWDDPASEEAYDYNEALCFAYEMICEK